MPVAIRLGTIAWPVKETHPESGAVHAFGVRILMTLLHRRPTQHA
jgi:hypothetical protein